MPQATERFLLLLLTRMVTLYLYQANVGRLHTNSVLCEWHLDVTGKRPLSCKKISTGDADVTQTRYTI